MKDTRSQPIPNTKFPVSLINLNLNALLNNVMSIDKISKIQYIYILTPHCYKMFGKLYIEKSSPNSFHLRASLRDPQILRAVPCAYL